jgi:prophage tail gpP-like protein
MSDKVTFKWASSAPKSKTSPTDGGNWYETSQVIDARIESDLYVAGDLFEIKLPRQIRVPKGARCQIYVNDQLEMNGLVDRASRGYDKKNGVYNKIEGRDLMGILVDSYNEEFFDIEGMTIKAVAERLLRNVPYINRREIIYANGADRLDASRKTTHIEPGSKVCETLQGIALSRGLLFYSLPDGRLVFGVPKGRTKNRYSIVNKDGINHSNVEEAHFVEDLSVRYSKIIAITQTQEDESVNVSAVKTDDTFPFYKPYVVCLDEDEASPGRVATMHLDRQRFEGTNVQYTVKGLSQNGRNWTIDEICSIDDEVLELKADMLVYSRTFRYSKKGGVYTDLQMSFPGVAK